MAEKRRIKKRFKKKIIIIPLVVILVVGGIVAGICYKRYNDSFAKVTSVAEITAMYFSDGMGEIVLLGEMQEGAIQNVNAKRELTIESVKVQKGDTVQKGDVLIEYDNDALQLNVDMTQTRVDTATNSIKIAENELSTLKGLIPAENAPATEPPTEAPENDDVQLDEPVAIEYEKTITKTTAPLVGDGSKDSPFVFNAGLNTVVTKEYMQYLAGAKAENNVPTEEPAQSAKPQANKNSKFAMLHIYNDKSVLLYSWLVDGSKLTEKDIKAWYCSAGVTISAEGNVQVEQGVNPFATLITYSNVDLGVDSSDELFNENDIVLEDIMAQLNNAENLKAEDFEFFYDGKITADDNYMYTQSELQNMISAKNDELSGLQFEKRQAEIDLENAKKMLETGSVVANINGTVTYVANNMEDALRHGSYITIVNDSVTTATALISENERSNVEVGMIADVRGQLGNAKTSGSVVDISEELSQGVSAEGMYDDTVSYYEVTIELDENIEVSGDGQVYVAIDTDSDKECIWLDTMFVRAENGKYYVLVANENNVLEKRYIKTGKKYFSYSIQVLEGLSEEDRIALPYGMSTEGTPTIDVSYDSMYSGFIF